MFGDQIEQIGIVGRGIYTLTSGMSQHLSHRKPDLVLKSKAGFRFLGEKPTIQLGMVAQNYVLKVTTPVDIGVNLIIMEQLEVLHKA